MCSAYFSKDDFKWSAVRKNVEGRSLYHIFSIGHQTNQKEENFQRRNHNYCSDNFLSPRLSCSRQVTLCQLCTLLLLSGDIATNPGPINFGLCSICSLKRNYGTSNDFIVSKGVNILPLIILRIWKIVCSLTREYNYNTRHSKPVSYETSSYATWSFADHSTL